MEVNNSQDTVFVHFVQQKQTSIVGIILVLIHYQLLHQCTPFCRMGSQSAEYTNKHRNAPGTFSPNSPNSKHVGPDEAQKNDSVTMQIP